MRKEARDHLALLQIFIETFEMIKTGHHLAKILQQLFIIHLLAKFSYFLVLFFADQLFKFLGCSSLSRDLALFGNICTREVVLELGMRAGEEGRVTASPRPVESSLRMGTFLFLPFFFFLFLADASTYGARTRASKKSERRLVWRRMILEWMDGGLIKRGWQQKNLSVTLTGVMSSI